MKLQIIVLLLKTFILPKAVLGHCSSHSALTSSDISLILKTSPIVVKAKVRKIRGDQSAIIKILEVYKGGQKLSVLISQWQKRSLQQFTRANNVPDRYKVERWPVNCRHVSRDIPIIIELSYIYNYDHNHQPNYDLSPVDHYSLMVQSVHAFTPNIEAGLYRSLGWKDWSTWTSCSSSCGGGVQHRYRMCLAANEDNCSDGRRREGRVCNTFSCSGSYNALSMANVRFFKPNPRTLVQLPDRLQGWRIRTGSYFLIPYKQASRSYFPQDWTIFLSFKADSFSQGNIFTLTDPQGKEENLSLNIAEDPRRVLNIHEGNLYLKIIHWSKNNTRTVTIPTYLRNNTWAQLAISIEGGRTIKTYLDCSWVTTQIIDGHNFHVTPNPDLVIGYMIQAEIDQLTITDNPADVAEQCSSTSVDEEKHMKHNNNRRNHGVYQHYKEEGSGETNDDDHADASGDDGLDQTVDDELDTDPGSGSSTVQFALEWSSWSGCSVSCGSEGVQSRWSRCLDTRDMMNCIQGGGERKETRICYVGKCEGRDSKKSARVRSSGTGTMHITQNDLDQVRERSLIRQTRRPNVVQFERIGKNMSEGRINDHQPSLPLGRIDTAGHECSCHNGGHCSSEPPYSCLCGYGWTGLLCDTPVCHPPCHHSGVCVRPDVCACQPGYTGTRCEEASCHPPCQNGGHCVEPFQCLCPPGFSGRFCQKCTGEDCQQSSEQCLIKCQNGGTCSSDVTKCKCKHGFYGDFCQKMTCSSYVRVKMPHVKSYRKKMTDSQGSGNPEYRIFYRTVYTSVTKCKEDLLL